MSSDFDVASRQAVADAAIARLPTLASDMAAAVAQALAARFPTEVVADTIYPVQFSVPSAVQRAGASNIGMSHRLHPWAGVAVADAAAVPN